MAADVDPASPRRIAPALILFDLDGTLVDSLPDLAASLAAAFVDFGLPPHGLAQVRAMMGEGQRVLVERALRAVGASSDRVDEALLRYRHHYSQRLTERTALYPGVRETLQRLPGIQKAVATNKPGAWARRLTAHFALDASFGWVMGEDDVDRRKPDPTMLLHLCERAGVAPAQALMVGDSHIDLDAAQAAGMPAALCVYGYGDAQTLEAAQKAEASAALPLGSRQRPYLLRGFADLLAIIETPATGQGM